MSSTAPRITVLAGGTEGAEIARALLAEHPDAAVTVVASTAGDLWVHGLKACPDLDTVMYALGDAVDPSGSRRDETRSAQSELAAYGVEPSWFPLGDREIATHLVRTQLLEAGYPLSAITARLCDRWLAPAYGDRVTLLPATDDRVETHVAVADPQSPSGRSAVHVREYLLRLGGAAPAETVATIGLESSTPAPGVLDAIGAADVVVVPGGGAAVVPAAVTEVPGVRAALDARTGPVVATAHEASSALRD